MQLRYVFTELLHGLRRNLSMHIAVVLTLFVSLTLVGLGVLLHQQATRTSEQWGNALQVTVFLCRSGDDNPACTTEVTDTQTKAVEKVLDDNPNVKSVDLKTKAQAFSEVKEMYAGENFDFSGPNAIITENDMGESLQVTLRDPRQTDAVIESVVDLDGVSTVRDVRETVGPILGAAYWMRTGGWVTAACLALAALLLVANTIRLAAFARRKEIAIMRLVGASTLYVALPFLLEALVTAIVGGALALGALAAFMQFVVRDRLVDQLSFILWVNWSQYWVAALFVAILGPLLTLLPTLLLTRKYIKV